eukprot:PhF_6_TR19048/c0_g1_i1/m.27988
MEADPGDKKEKKEKEKKEKKHKSSHHHHHHEATTTNGEEKNKPAEVATSESVPQQPAPPPPSIMTQVVEAARTAHSAVESDHHHHHSHDTPPAPGAGGAASPRNPLLMNPLLNFADVLAAAKEVSERRDPGAASPNASPRHKKEKKDKKEKKRKEEEEAAAAAAAAAALKQQEDDILERYARAAERKSTFRSTEATRMKRRTETEKILQEIEEAAKPQVNEEEQLELQRQQEALEEARLEQEKKRQLADNLTTMLRSSDKGMLYAYFRKLRRYKRGARIVLTEKSDELDKMLAEIQAREEARFQEAERVRLEQQRILEERRKQDALEIENIMKGCRIQRTYDEFTSEFDQFCEDLDYKELTNGELPYSGLMSPTTKTKYQRTFSSAQTVSSHPVSHTDHHEDETTTYHVSPQRVSRVYALPVVTAPPDLADPPTPQSPIPSPPRALRTREDQLRHIRYEEENRRYLRYQDVLESKARKTLTILTAHRTLEMYREERLHVDPNEDVVVEDPGDQDVDDVTEMEKDVDKEREQLAREIALIRYQTMMLTHKLRSATVNHHL